MYACVCCVVVCVDVCLWACVCCACDCYACARVSVDLCLCLFVCVRARVCMHASVGVCLCLRHEVLSSEEDGADMMRLHSPLIRSNNKRWPLSSDGTWLSPGRRTDGWDALRSGRRADREWGESVRRETTSC